ncbi:hypothetical protein GCM10022247_01690 [Allokutzneria multivorans]|uniref:Secreted protein n=1 Tax=Allokutzneria multivorans TaxID=1142134 RepID=A0ABP7QRU6_9PSEU
MLKKIGAFTGAAALAVGLVTGTASTAQAAECGGYVTFMGNVEYNHCGTGNVLIHVDRLNIGGIKDYEKCVPPGITKLGAWPDWKGAHYLRPC